MAEFLIAIGVALTAISIVVKVDVGAYNAVA